MQERFTSFTIGQFKRIYNLMDKLTNNTDIFLNVKAI